MNKDYFTVDQIAKMLNMHPKTVQRYIREGKLRAAKIGKSWRVTGHDLSTFVENGSFENPTSETKSDRSVIVSSVVDINVGGKDEAIRIMNTLTASMNAKPSYLGQTSMHSQYIEHENMVRITLWGGVRFMAIIMDTIASLTDQNDEE